MLLAEALAARRLRRNVMFVCFAAEERGLRGSRAFCERPPVPLERVSANLNIEMIGRPEKGNQRKCWITGAGYSDFAEVCAQALATEQVEVIPFRMADSLFGASDNASFAAKGVVAHSVSAGSLHEDYHQPGDEVQKLDIPHMTKIVRGLFDVTVALADREGDLSWSERGEAFVERLKGRRR